MANKKISALTSATTPLAGTEVLPIVQSSSTVKVAVSDLTTGRNVTAANFTASSTTTNAGVFADYNSTNVGRMVASSNGNLYFGQQTGSGTVSFGTSANGDLIFLNGTQIGLGTTSTTETVNFGGNARLNTGNLVIGTSGKGIDFSATPGTGTSELFADYEEGTWTPALLFDSSMVGSFTYTTQVGTYTKVGRLVTASFNLVWTARPSGGLVMVLNLPFTAVNAKNVRGFISDQGGITNIGTYAIIAGDGLVITNYVSTQCAISTVKSGAAFADPLQQTALTSASGQLFGEIIFEVS